VNAKWIGEATMNVKEGTRRLALLVGVLGAAFGCFASYVVLRDAMGARARYKAFERLEKSNVVQQERKSVQEEHESFFRSWVGPWDEYREAPDDTVTTWKSFSPERREELLAKMTPEQKHKLRAVIEQQTQRDEQDPYAEFQKPAESAKRISKVNEGGIKAIHWTKDLGVESLDTEDGMTLYPTPAPTPWPYLLAVIFPVFGFVIPWASARALTWVGVGFFEKSK
jgi:hypothetical protein